MPDKQGQKRTIKLVLLLDCYKKVKNIVWHVGVKNRGKGLRKCHICEGGKLYCTLNQLHRWKLCSQ
jgi:hypothetical protein